MKEVSVEQLKAMRDNGESHQLIDVREPNEFQSINIGGELIPMATVPDNLNKIRKDIPVVVHCRSGARSGNIVNYLETQGFQNVSNLQGGILAWIDRIDKGLTQ